MKEQLIVSGRLNEYVDPYLSVWPWPIPFYLFVGGVAAGILFFAALFYLQGKATKFPTAVFRAPVIVPVLLVLGLAALFYDLSHKLFFWRLYTSLNIEAPMSWGAWTLMVVTPAAFIWVALDIKRMYPGFTWPIQQLHKLEAFFSRYRSHLAWVVLLFAIALGMYTGILLSAFNARPLWNTSVLGLLFLVSGLSTGAAVIALMSKSHEEKHYFAKIDLMLVGIELALIVHMFMGFMASTQAQINAAEMFLGGPFTFSFWFFVVGLGLVVPAALAALVINGKKIPHFIAPVLILIGGVFLRFIFVQAGQLSAWM